MRLPFSSFILIAIFATAPRTLAATLHVPADYSTIQACIDAAVSGQDECVVAPGTYHELINFLGKAITLRSESGPEVTTIDGTGLNGSVVTCASGEAPQTVLDGFTITGGTGTNNDGYTHGGGMYNHNSSPTVTNSTFSGNRVTNGGGGMFNYSAAPTITNCTFSGNTAADRYFGGGGMYNFANSNPTVINCTFIGNTSYDAGGGMYNSVYSSPTVTDCTFSGNEAHHGGGMYNSDSSPTLTNCTFRGNTAQGSGGGMGNVSNSPTLTNCTFSGNTAGIGGAMYNNYTSSPSLTNCIFWGHSTNEIVAESSPTTFRFSDVQGGLPIGAVDGGGNINSDPMFVRNPFDGGDGWGDDPSTPNVNESLNDDFGDLRLQPGSPCINAGDPDFVPLPGETDLDGHARVLCGRVDMGAYEFGIGDYDCNQMVNLADVSVWPTCATDPVDTSAATKVHQDSPYNYNARKASPHPNPLPKGEGEAIVRRTFRGLAPPATHHRPFGAGPTPGPLPKGEGAGACEAFDSDADGDVDLFDFAALQNAFTGMECLGDADCDDADACTSDACEGDGACSHAAIEGCCNFDFECDDGLSCTADTCNANHTCVNAAIPGCVKHAFATFTDPVSGFATQSVRDVNGDIVKFDPARWSIVYVATGAEYQVGYWPVTGNLLGYGGSFQVRFGTVLGEHRAFFTETGSGTICDFVVTPSSFLIYSTNTPVPHT